MTTERQRVRDILRRAAAEFERNGLSRCAIRQCEQEVPDLFLEEGLQVLLDSDDSAGYRFLSVLLVNASSVYQRLTNRWQFSREQAVQVAKRLQRVDQNFDTKLTGLLPDRNQTARPFALEGEQAERALEILDEISPGRRIVPIMRHLTKHPDRRVSSKAAMLIGKRLQNISWAKRVIMESTDPRLRANAIETMWGLNGADVVEMFRGCLEDADNRVVGNAIIGLHRAGDAKTSELVGRIASDPNPKLRMTAAWAMGQIGDGSMTAILSPLAKDNHPEVRRAALRSMRGFQIEEEKRAAQIIPVAEPEPDHEEPVPVAGQPPGIERRRQFWG